MAEAMCARSLTHRGPLGPSFSPLRAAASRHPIPDGIVPWRPCALMCCVPATLCPSVAPSSPVAPSLSCDLTLRAACLSCAQVTCRRASFTRRSTHVVRVVVVHLHVRARARARPARYLCAVVRVARAVSLVLIHMISMRVVIHTSRYSRALIKLFRHIIHVK
jgi:hypothetical protein